MINERLKKHELQYYVFGRTCKRQNLFPPKVLWPIIKSTNKDYNGYGLEDSQHSLESQLEFNREVMG